MPGVYPALHAQSLSFVLAGDENEPDGQTWQSLGPLLTVSLYVPAPHAAHVAYEPVKR